MRIGVVGAGKLGLPVALAIDAKGHSVSVTDINEDVKGYLDLTKPYPYKEEGLKELLKDNEIEFYDNIKSVVATSDIIFVPVQTPHSPEYEGSTIMPSEGADFDYTYLKKVMLQISEVIENHMLGEVMVVIISTCLPGTIDREIVPFITKRIKLVYNPFFIAMGTVIHDFYNPEFVLLGVNKDRGDYYDVKMQIEDFYKSIHKKECVWMDIAEAELTKVAYNTFISTKIAYANVLMEICDKMGMRVNKVTAALKLANERLLSPRYLEGGMGDGGGCHPRDNIAMSYLAERLDLSYNMFESIMRGREKQAAFIADKASYWAPAGKPIYLLGASFKPGTNITTGSPALLVKGILEEDYLREVIVKEGDFEVTSPQTYLIGCKEKIWEDVDFSPGSTVIDPFRYLHHLRLRNDINYIPIGG